MSVIVVSWALSRKVETGDGWEFQTLLHVVKNVFSASDAAHAVAEGYYQTPEAQDGWELIGPPSALIITHEIYTDWEPYIEPPAANTGRKTSHLKPVP